MGDGAQPANVQAADARGWRILCVPARAPGNQPLKRLIVTADDFGLAEDVNDAVEKAHRDGVLGAASLMVAGPAASHALKIAKRLPALRVGLHLVLVDGCPVLPATEIPDLVDGQGRLSARMVRMAVAHAIRPTVRRQTAREIEAQFAAFARTGLTLDHVNAHEHFHVHPGIGAQVLAIGGRHAMKALRVPFEPAGVLSKIEKTRSTASLYVMAAWTRLLGRRAAAAGVLTPDAVFGLRWTGQMTASRFRGLLDNLPEGTSEIYFHPATSDRFAGHAASYRYRDELAALTNPSIIEMMQAGGLRAGGYADSWK